MPTTPPLLVLLLTLLQLVNAVKNILEFIPLVEQTGLFIKHSSFSVFDTAVCVAVSIIILAMPVNPGGREAQVPLRERQRLDNGEIIEETEDLQRDYELCPCTPEDYASLISTLTYTWMQPIQKLAMQRPLLPSDIWRLRSINETSLLSHKFSELKKARGTSLGRRLLLANANDIALDFTYKLCGVTLAYAGPALMRAILQCISDAAQYDGSSIPILTSSGLQSSQSTPRLFKEANWTPRSKAFVFALLGFVFTLVRYVAELKNFHHARQVGLRIRSILVIEMFEKALRRRFGAGSGPERSSSHGDNDAITHVRRDTTETLGDQGDQLNQAAEQEGFTESEPLLSSESSSSIYPQELNEETLKDEQSQADVGKLVNMMASDINVLLRLGCDSHQLYGAPLEVIIATTFLYRLLGWAALAGLSLLLLGLPVNYLLGRFYIKTQKNWRAATDNRISLVSELINAIRFIKIQGTQSRWIDRVSLARRKELHLMIRARMNEFFLVLFWAALPIASTLLTFYVYVVVQEQPLTVPVAFTTLTLSSMLRTPLNVIPSFAMSILQAITSVRRLEGFLSEEEVDDSVSTLKRIQVLNPTTSTLPSESSIVLNHATFSWSGNRRANTSDSFILEDITFSLPMMGLCVIEGPTASGKSSLLAALMGELKLTSGSYTFQKFDKNGKSLFSFAGQNSWLEAGKSIKDNITFITPFDKDRYELVVDACALHDDFILFDDGDETRVSKETLSGGQKARICLARSLYHPSLTVFLDDVLSAVDTRVQRHIYTHALTGPIAQGRRIVLATHHVSLVLPSTNYLVRLRNGQVTTAGYVSELIREGALDINDESEPSSGSLTPTSKKNEVIEQPDADERVYRKFKANDVGSTKRSARLLYSLEARQSGNIQWSSYKVYLRAAPTVIWLVIFSISITLRLGTAGEQYWLKVWGEADAQLSLGLPSSAEHQQFYLTIYSIIGFTIVFLVGLRGVAFWTATYMASKKLYTELLFNVVRAKVRFFDKNPAGRILQRFNLDISVLDSDLPQSALNFSNNALAFTSSALICILIIPMFSVPVIGGLIFAFWGVRGFLKTTMYMQRIESTSTSPMYSAFTQIIEGLPTVRAFGAESFFLDRMQTITTITSSQWWAICTIEVWLSFRAQLLSGISVFLATCLALSGAISPGSAGMVISSSSLLTTFAYYLTSDYKHVSNNGNSVERIKEYIQIEQEAPEIVSGYRIPAAWPSNDAAIHVRDLSLRYDADLPEVLHSISFDIKPREKIAIVGRTGSGKTSLVSAFMRSVEPCSSTASIIIDGLDILQSGLEYRNRITVVPQDPILFSGTIRHNLDPFNERSDEECRWALERVRINQHASFQPKSSRKTLIDLDTPVTAGSSYLSSGQAQLICLARALLREATVVILDEATSSTDLETDANIQNAIREMKQSIIIAVAHRLTTVIDYDRILVLSKGEVVEFDTPQSLLSKADDDVSAHFKALCREAGPVVYRQLCTAAGVNR